MTLSVSKPLKISFQGVVGSYGYITSTLLFPSNAQYVPHDTFKETIDAVCDGNCDYAVLPIENSNSGRVEQLISLLPQLKLFIVGEYVLPVKHQLLGLQGSSLEDIRTALSHPQALSQCSMFLSSHNITTQNALNTAMACLTVIEKQDNTIACIASSLAAETYKLQILAKNIQNDKDNKTRFLVFSATPTKINDNKEGKSITSILVEFNTQQQQQHGLMDMIVNLAKHNLNIRKLETYSTENNFKSNVFYIEIEADMNDDTFTTAYTYIKHISSSIRILGCYKSLLI